MARWFEPQPFVTPIVDAPHVGRFVSYAAALVIFALTIRGIGICPHCQRAPMQIRRLSLVLSATLILSPIVCDHYYVLLLLPLAELYRSSSPDRMLRTLMLACVVLPLSHRYWPLMFSLQSPVFMSAGAAGAIVLWIALLKMVSYDRVCAVKPRPSVTNPSAI